MLAHHFAHDIVVTAHRCRNKPKISGAIWAFGIKTLRALKFFSGSDWFFSNIFYSSGIEMSPHYFQEPFGPLVLTFCGPSPNFEGNWPEGPPYNP